MYFTMCFNEYKYLSMRGWIFDSLMDTAKSFSFFVITVRDNNNHYFKIEITKGSENITAIGVLILF